MRRSASGVASERFPLTSVPLLADQVGRPERGGFFRRGHKQRGGERFALREETIGQRARCRDMCERCKEIDAKIVHYQQVADRITDQTTIAGLNDLIRDLLRKRAALHPDHSEDEPA